MDTDHSQKLAEIFRAVFNLSDAADVSKVRQINHAAWDSLAHVTLISAIESEFGLAIDIGDSMDMTSFDAGLAYLEEHPA